MSTQIYIYSPLVSNRLNYTLRVVFSHVLNLEYTLINELENLPDKAALISYGQEISINAVSIPTSGLLNQTGIEKQTVNIGEWNDTPVLFDLNSKMSLSFDFFSAVFYLISRYEEYLPFKPDKHGRFPASQSILFQNDLLEFPLVNIWSWQLLNLLEKKFPSLKFISEKKFSFIPTFDIDQAWSYKNKGFKRFYGALFMDLLNGRFSLISEKIKVVAGIKKDPFDTFDFILSGLNEFLSDSIFFFQCGSYGKYDKNPSVFNKKYRELIAKISRHSECGIHPSYASDSNEFKIQKEKEKLKSILNKPVSKSRQHYIRLKIPQTYSALVKAGINEDYSMGYPEIPGFRAGVCSAYPFYDLFEENITPLMIFPFCIMDATLIYYLKLDAITSKKLFKKLLLNTYNAGGTFMPLWHNDILNSENWKEAFVFLIDEVRKLKISK